MSLDMTTISKTPTNNRKNRQSIGLLPKIILVLNDETLAYYLTDFLAESAHYSDVLLVQEGAFCFIFTGGYS